MALNAPRQIPSLDGLRGVSVLIVFAGHVEELIPPSLGLSIFFFLSGYLITTLLAREADRHGSISFRAFYMRRALRILPPLAVLLAVGLIAMRLHLLEGPGDPVALVSQLLFFYNYHSLLGPEHSMINGDGVLWSLSVEEQFYLIFPAIFLLIARGHIRIVHVILLLAAILAWRYVRFLALGSDYWAIYRSTDTRFDALLFGCLLALLDWKGYSRLIFRPQLMWLFLALALGAILYTLVERDPTFRSTLRYSIQSLALMPIFYYAVLMPDCIVFRPLNWPVMRLLGLYSYNLYLCHDIILFELERQGIARGEPIGTALAFGLAVAYSALLYRFVEKPLRGLRVRTTGHHRPATPDPTRRTEAMEQVSP